MTLSWSIISERWPDACVMWDRDVAPMLTRDPVFVERGSVFDAWDSALFADDPDCPHQRGQWSGRETCRCLVWTGDEWLARHEVARRVDLMRRIGERIPLRELANILTLHDWHVRTLQGSSRCRECFDEVMQRDARA